MTPKRNRSNYFFFPLDLDFAGVLEVVDPTLPALDVVVDVTLLPAPDLTTSSCLFYIGRHVSTLQENQIRVARACLP